MDLFDFREPVSAWSHCTWLLMSMPSTVFLLRRCGCDRSKQISLLVFGLSLAACYGGSTLFHGVNSSEAALATYAMLDHIGIYILIAGTYTPIACNLLHGRWRWGTLLFAWGGALAGSLLQFAYGHLPNSLCTAFYLVMGWGAIFCYTEISRNISRRALSPIWVGGVLYSVGAGINLLEWPNFWPGVFGAHELFHLFVMAGSGAHFWFMFSVVVPHEPGARYLGSGPHLDGVDTGRGSLLPGASRFRRVSASTGA